MKTIQQLQRLCKQEKEHFNLKRKHLGQLNTKQLEQNFLETSNKVWACSDCLKCANCCKTISPIIEFEDIHNMAKHLAMEAGAFMEKFIEMDEDGDFVFTSQPCPMLDKTDNKCKVYESRPKACRQYPHLDQVNSKKMLDLAFKNTSYCGVVFDTIKSLDECQNIKSL